MVFHWRCFMRPSLTRSNILVGRVPRCGSELLFHVLWKAAVAQMQMYGTAHTEFVICDQSIDRNRRHDLPLVSRRTCTFARTPLAYMTGMSHEITVDLQPRWLAFQFLLQGRPCISLTRKAPRAQMPTRPLPTDLCMVDLSLQRSLCSLLGSGGAHDDPAFAALRQGHDPTIPLDATILGPLPVLTAFL